MAEMKIEPGRTRRGRLSAFIRDKKGVTAVEFALIAAPFLALLVAIIQTFLVFFAQELLESAVMQASRQIMTGQTQAQTSGQSNAVAMAAFHQTVCNNVSVLFNCTGLMVDVEVATSWSAANTAAPVLTYNGSGQVTNAWQFTPGNAGDIVIVKVIYLWPVFLGPLGFNLSNQANGTRMIMATAAFQNEPAS
jgi:Flp pilus assembly protein TadG